jgi:hypothetical protein
LRDGIVGTRRELDAFERVVGGAPPAAPRRPSNAAKKRRFSRPVSVG